MPTMVRAKRDRQRIGRARDERGASAVELAIVLSVLLLFVFVVIQFGIAYNRNQGIAAASREGARVASVGASEADIGARVRNALSLFDPNDVLVRIDYSTDDGASYPGGNLICDDASGSNRCNQTTAPVPCGTAQTGNLVRVTATVPGSTGRYAIIIPLWGNHNVTFTGVGVFRCEEG
jgi:Flp pilus assembly protein TadG